MTKTMLIEKFKKEIKESKLTPLEIPGMKLKAVVRSNRMIKIKLRNGSSAKFPLGSLVGISCFEKGLSKTYIIAAKFETESIPEEVAYLFPPKEKWHIRTLQEKK